jgi:glutamate-5-semialdehyde dehydrogenase
MNPSSSSSIETLLSTGKQAFMQMSTLTTDQKNEALEVLATLIEAHTPELLQANQQDLAENENSLDAALYQRLKLDEGKLKQLVEGIRQVKTLPDPVGKILAITELDDGLILTKKSVPLGLIGIVFESPPRCHASDFIADIKEW